MFFYFILPSKKTASVGQSVIVGKFKLICLVDFRVL